jgi:hypothetical protein
MASEKQEPTSLKAAIEARIAKWQAVLDALAAAQEIDAAELSTVPTPAMSGDLGHPIDLPKGAFYGKSVPACVELYLSAGKVKRTNKEIAAALREGGVESNADKFDTVIAGALFKLKKDGKILRFKDGWGMAEWYPAHIRTVAPISGNSPKKKSRKPKKASRKSSAVPTAKPSAKPSEERTDELPHGKVSVATKEE